MKIVNKSKATVRVLIAAIILSVVATSCVKEDNVISEQISGLSVIHGSPTTEKFDFFLGANKGNATDFSYTNKLDYLDVISGNRRFTITKKGLTTPLLSDTMTLKPEKGYSLFLVDKIETLKYILIKDDLTTPVSGKARIRFVNASPDAPALNLAIAGSTTDIFINKGFRQFSEFESINAAEKVTFNVKNKESGIVEATIPDVRIEAGKIYTIWVKGLKAATGDTKLGLAIFTHK